MSLSTEQFPELPASPRRIALFAVLALLAGVGLSWWVDRPPGPECVGYLTVRSTVVHARQNCVVESLAAKPGDIVRIGDQLFTLRDESLLDRIAAKEAEIATLKFNFERAQAKADVEIRWRMRTLEAEICELQLRSATYLKEKYDFETQRTMLTEVLSRSKSTAAAQKTASLEQVVLEQPVTEPERLSTIVQLEAAANAVEVSAAQLEICNQQESRLAELKKHLPEQLQKTMGVDVAAAALKRGQVELEQLQKKELTLAVTSPAIGRVGLYRAEAGDHVQAGQPIVELLDNSERHLVVHVPSQAAPRFSQGTAVSVVFPGGMKRKGEVARVAPQTQAATSDLVDATVLVEVEQSGATWPEVAVGSQVRVRPAR